MEYLHSVIRLTSKGQLTKRHLWKAISYGVRCYGNDTRMSAAYPIHSICKLRLPLHCKFDANELQEDSSNGYKLRNLDDLYLHSKSSRMSDVFPFTCKKTLEGSVLGISRQPICKGIRYPKLEDQPKYNPVESEKPKLSWWRKLSNSKKEEEIEYCGEPISLVPEDIEDEISRRKCQTCRKICIHPLVDRIGCNPPSFKPKDMPGPFNHIKENDKNIQSPPRKKSWIKNLFSKEPKTEVVYPPNIPQAKVMTYEELCYFIKNMLMTPARYDCGRRYPDLCFHEIPTPFYSEGCRLPCAPKTFVSPSLSKSNSQPSTPKTPTIPSKIQGQSHQGIYPPPVKKVCDGKTPINEMSPPFHSECTEPWPRPFYSVCKNDSSRCLQTESTEKPKGKEPCKQPQKQFSQCTPHLHPANRENKNQ